MMVDLGVCLGVDDQTGDDVSSGQDTGAQNSQDNQSSSPYWRPLEIKNVKSVLEENPQPQKSHTLVPAFAPNGSGKKMRKRCSPCYHNLVDKCGSSYARSNTRIVHTVCDACDVAMCTECFAYHIHQTESIVAPSVGE
uniref:Uncharacterized protein n=1 Tax=Cacopsylla melanoneura TaxID=428564 RepID=A0A8D8YPJ4_9HEMI